MPDDTRARQEISSHYESGYEAQRLAQGTSRLELARTQELLERFLPPPPAVVLDVGGGPGVYAFWLAQKGYAVHLLDVMPVHIEQARAASEHSATPLASLRVGDARELPFADASADLVLMLGPLYHLTERVDRIHALREGQRVLRAGGRLVAAAISRFTSTLDGLVHGYLDDEAFVQIARQDLHDGQHRNPSNHPAYFTTAFFHHPDDLKADVEAAGLAHERTLPVEGPGWLLQDFDQQWADARRRARLLEAIRWLEDEPSLLGASAHLLVVARKAPQDEF